MNLKNFLFLCMIFAACTAKNNRSALETLIDINSFKNHLTALSQDSLKGRDTGSPGYDSASIYIERRIKNLALHPGGVNLSYRQYIDFQQSELIGKSAKLTIDGVDLVSDSDFILNALAGPDSINITAPLVFAGFGFENPANDVMALENLNVSGKIVMIIRGAPETYGMVERAVTTSDEFSNQSLMDKGALAVIRVIPESYQRVRSWEVMVNRAKRPQMNYINPENKNDEIPSVSLNYQSASKIFDQVGKDYSAVLDSLIKGHPISFDFGFTCSLSGRFTHQQVRSHNLAGIIKGADPVLKDEYLVVSAHLDHIGVGPMVNGDSIYNGTLDNASGSAALLVLAEAFKKLPPTKRSILFLWATAEEKGLLGSEYFAKYPTFENLQIAANLNIDGIIGMIMETTDVIAYGYEHSNLSESVDHAVQELGMKVSPDPQPELNIFVRSDQYSFVKQGYPALYVVSGRTASSASSNGLALFNNWLTHRYHKPSDDMDQPISYSGIEKELQVNYLIANHIANRTDALAWNKESFLYNMFVK